MSWIFERVTRLRPLRNEASEPAYAQVGSIALENSDLVLSALRPALGSKSQRWRIKALQADPFIPNGEKPVVWAVSGIFLSNRSKAVGSLVVYLSQTSR